MIYPGDTHQIVFSLSHANGTTPSVTTAPLVTVINLTTGAAVVTAAAMTLVAGTCLVYSYAWNTAGMRSSCPKPTAPSSIAPPRRIANRVQPSSPLSI